MQFYEIHKALAVNMMFCTKAVSDRRRVPSDNMIILTENTDLITFKNYLKDQRFCDIVINNKNYSFLCSCVLLVLTSFPKQRAGRTEMYGTAPIG